MFDKSRMIPFRNMLWVRQHPMRLALVATLAAIVGALFLTPFSGAIASPMLQLQPSPTPAAQEAAMIAVPEFDGSG